MKTSSTGELREAIGSLRGAFFVVALLSGALNVLLLGGSIYMMLVYDSVLPSRSVPTLVGLLVMVLTVYGFQGIFDAFRSRLLNDIAISFDQRLSSRVQDAAFTARRGAFTGATQSSNATRDLDTVRAFLSGPGPAAFIDAPWMIFFLAILAVLHIWLAATALAGACIMAFLTFLTYRASARPIHESVQVGVVRQTLGEERFRHAETIYTLGMEQNLRNRWDKANQAFLATQDRVARATNFYGGLSRVFRITLQSLILTVGAVLVISDRASGGVIFASSILSARALAPIDQIIGQWRSFAGAREGWKRLDGLLSTVPPATVATTRLPRPQTSLTMESVAVGPPGSERITAHGASFVLEAGDVLGIIGASGSGKSSIARAIAGAWPLSRGAVRLDGAALEQYDPQERGRFLGYLPQTVELLSGTVGENISRFSSQHDSAAIVAAARQAGVHDLIVSLPMGYETPVGADGEQLSGGQRQRIALARALYGDPFVVVLDEPNSNLDEDGEVSLDAAIQTVRDRGGIVVIVTHRGQAIRRASKLLYMADGVASLFGPRESVLSVLRNSKAIPAGENGAKRRGIKRDMEAA
ncbi:type I secretion system ATPase [Novosphingobium sp. MD-1]|nr:type I secretion system ATPase [Novosphingobium sp. MD-1]